MRKTLESKVEAYLRVELHNIGLECMKYIPDHSVGMPDRMVVLPGRQVLWVEVKTDGGKLSEIQKYRHAWLRQAGHDVRVVWSKEQVDDLVRELIDERIAAVK